MTTIIGPILSVEPIHLHNTLARMRSMRLEFRPTAGWTPKAVSGLVDEKGVSGLAIIKIVGTMLEDADEFDEFFGFTSTTRITQAVQAATANSSIAGIILYVNSPGGSVNGVTELADAVADANKAKPVVAQVSGLAASAAYWAIAQSRAIYGNRTSLVGSIGAITTLYDYSKALADAGIVPVTVSSEPDDPEKQLKRTGIFGEPVTDGQRAHLQALIDGYFAEFRNAVLAGRSGKISAEQFAGLTDGRVVMGAEARRLNLIDGIQTFADTVRGMTGAQLNGSLARAKIGLMERTAR